LRKLEDVRRWWNVIVRRWIILLVNQLQHTLAPVLPGEIASWRRAWRSANRIRAARTLIHGSALMREHSYATTDPILALASLHTRMTSSSPSLNHQNASGCDATCQTICQLDLWCNLCNYNLVLSLSLYFSLVCTLFSPTASQGFHPLIMEGYYRALLYPPSLPNTPFAECISTDCK
jgi:hypothetical protein